MLIQYYQNLPDKTKKIIYPFTLPFKLLISVSAEMVFDVYMLSGKSDNKIKKGLYITSSDIIPYFIERIYDNGYEITKIKKIYIWELRKLIKEEDVIIDIHKCFVKFLNIKNGFIVPILVRQILDLDKPVDNIVKKNKDFKKFSRYQCEISTDHNALKFFYDKMYVPYIKRRFANSAYIETFENITRIFEKGELLFSKYNDKLIAAALCEMKDDTYFFHKVGVLDESFIKEGGLSVTYYFAIQRANEKNAKKIDFGQSRPFLSDGVLRHKRKWGTRICEDKSINRKIYLNNMIKQPFIFVEDKKLKAIVFSNDDKFIAKYAKSGLEFKVV